MSIKKEFLAAYDKYAASILRHIYFRVSDWKLAEDLTQETFFKAWKYIISGNKEIKSFKFFLYKIASNLIIDYYRQKPKTPLFFEDIRKRENLQDSEQKEGTEALFNKDLVEKCLLELKEDHRQIVIYRYIDGFSIEEISKITGKSKENISVIIHRSLKILKEKIYPV